MKELGSFARIAYLTGWDDVVFGMRPQFRHGDEVISGQFDRGRFWNSTVHTGVVELFFDGLPLGGCNPSHSRSLYVCTADVVSPAPKCLPLRGSKPCPKRGTLSLPFHLQFAFFGQVVLALMFFHPELVFLCFPILGIIGFAFRTLLPPPQYFSIAFALTIILRIQSRILLILFRLFVCLVLRLPLRSLAVVLLRLSNGLPPLCCFGVFQRGTATAGPALRLKSIALSLVRTEHGDGEVLPAG